MLRKKNKKDREALESGRSGLKLQLYHLLTICGDVNLTSVRLSFFIYKIQTSGQC